MYIYAYVHMKRYLQNFDSSYISLDCINFCQVRMRDTFMKVGQSLLVKRQLGMEKQLKEKMIHSVMPPKVKCSCRYCATPQCRQRYNADFISASV